MIVTVLSLDTLVAGTCWGQLFAVTVRCSCGGLLSKLCISCARWLAHSCMVGAERDMFAAGSRSCLSTQAHAGSRLRLRLKGAPRVLAACQSTMSSQHWVSPSVLWSIPAMPSTLATGYPPGGAMWIDKGCSDLTGTSDEQLRTVVNFLQEMEIRCERCQAR